MLNDDCFTVNKAPGGLAVNNEYCYGRMLVRNVDEVYPHNNCLCCEHFYALKLLSDGMAKAFGWDLDNMPI